MILRALALSSLLASGFPILDSGLRIQDQGSRIKDSITIDRILAVVSNQTIMLSDVTAAIEFRLVIVPTGTSDPTEYLLDRLIRRRLILAEVERFQPPEPAPIEITGRIEAMEKAAGSPVAFDAALAVTGMTRDQLGRYIRDDLRIETYLNERFPERPDVDRAAAIDAWVAELRKRTEIVLLYHSQ